MRSRTSLLALALHFAVACTPAPPAPSREVPPLGTSTPVVARCKPEALSRIETRVPGGDPGIELLLLRVPAFGTRRGAVVFAHGAGSGASASFDLFRSGRSFMRALACAGFDTYAADARGFGGSTPPPELAGPRDASPPVVRATDAARDLEAVVRFATRTSSLAQVDVIGWSWGSDVAGLYAGRHPERVRRLILVSPVYDRRWPTRHETKTAWRPEVRAEIERHFDPAREDRAAWDEFVASLFRFAPSGELRLPNGPYRDLYGDDAPVWDAGAIRAPTLIVRGDLDKASLAPHAERLYEHLVAAPERRLLVLGGVGHFPFRERRFAQLFGGVIDFLTVEL